MAAPDDNEISEVPSQRTVTKPDDLQVEDDIEAPAPLKPNLPVIDPVIEKRVLRKLDRRVPIVTGFLCTYKAGSCMFYGCVLIRFQDLLAFLDRSNIGYNHLQLSAGMRLTTSRNAKIAGMQTELSLNGASYSWLLTIFYISYTLFEFQALMWKLIPPHRWAAFTVALWYGSLARVYAFGHSLLV